MAKVKRKATGVDRALFDAVCHRIAEGETLSRICRDDGMPARNTVYDWIDADEELAGQFARARERGADVIAERCLEIAHDETHDWVFTKKGEVTNEVAMSRARLQVDTHLRLLAKWHPRRYGDKLELAGSKDAPLLVQVNRLTEGSK